MAKLGLKYPVYAIGTESGSSISYADGGVIAKAISANIAITTSDVKLFADDVSESGMQELDMAGSSGSHWIKALKIIDNKIKEENSKTITVINKDSVTNNLALVLKD